MPTSRIESHFLEAEKILREFILSGNIQNIEIAGKIMVASLRKGGKIIS